MSKKSAKSKGYRNFKKEKPFLTKKEIYALIAICAVIIIGFVAFLCYDDGALKLEDGMPVGVENNWVVGNGGTASAPRYFKIGEAGEIEGFTTQPYRSYSDIRVQDVYYNPSTEENPIEYISISTASTKNTPASELGKPITEAFESLESYTLTTPLTTAKVGDIDYTYYAFTTEVYIEPEAEATEATEDAAATEENAEETAAVEEAPAEEAVVTEEAAAEETGAKEPNTFGQSLSAYVDASHDCCLLIHVVNETESADEFMTDEEMRAVLEKAIAAFTFEK